MRRHWVGVATGAMVIVTAPALAQVMPGAKVGGSPNVHLVLSDAGTDDATNAPARQALTESHTDLTSRMMPSESTMPLPSSGSSLVSASSSAYINSAAMKCLSFCSTSTNPPPRSASSASAA